MSSFTKVLCNWPFLPRKNSAKRLPCTSVTQRVAEMGAHATIWAMLHNTASSWCSKSKWFGGGLVTVVPVVQSQYSTQTTIHARSLHAYLMELFPVYVPAAGARVWRQIDGQWSQTCRQHLLLAKWQFQLCSRATNKLASPGRGNLRIISWRLTIRTRGGGRSLLLALFADSGVGKRESSSKGHLCCFSV